eukprot:gene15317-biopygen6262
MHRIEDVEGTEQGRRPRMAQMRNEGSMAERAGKLSQGSGLGRRRCRRGGCRVRGGARRMTQVLKPGPRQWRQGGLCKGSEGVEGQRKAWKHWAPREVTE